jgi:phytol kinase
MTSSNRSNLGTVYFPLAFAVIVWLFWENPALLVASLMPLTWGDALAAVVGERYGRHVYHVFGSTRSLEGSLAAFGFSAIATGIVLAGFGIPDAAGAALVVALGAALAEAISPWGLDNLTIPAVSAMLLAWLVG